MATPKKRRGTKRVDLKTATANRLTTTMPKLPGLKLPKTTSFVGEPPPDRFQLAEWWQDDLKSLVQMLVDFVGTLAQLSETARELVGESLREQFNEIREALIRIVRVPRCLQLVLALVRDAGTGGSPMPLGMRYNKRLASLT